MELKHPLVIAGPCSAESEDQVLNVAHQLKKTDATVFRAGIWKPRTRPGNFEGVGETGLKWLKKVIAQTGLKKEAHKKIGELSKGYRQRVGLASALLHQPEVLILDEPTTGLDPNQLLEIRELVKKVANEADITVLFSTHIMQEVEAICDRVIIINNGVLIHDKSISDTLKESNLETLFSKLTNQK